VDVCEPQDINPVALVGFEKILVTAGALKQLEERLA
jgi:large subunit ribosomal protein L4